MRPNLAALIASSLLAFAGCSSETGDPSAPPAGQGSGPAAPPAEGPQTTAPRFVAGPCRFLVPKSADGTTVKCGDVIVPENREAEDGRTIKLHVAVFPGDEALPPTFELIGGPGGGADPTVGYLAAGDALTAEEHGFLRERGDYVIFDQRGIGRSEPNLSCAPEIASASQASTFLGIMTRCRDRLAGEGVDLRAYTTYDNALDVDDIRRALGYEKIDLHAISYGTLLALEVMRHRPQGVRSVVLDGVLPPEAKLLGDTPRTIDENLTRIFSSCAGQPACKAAFPDLEGSLTALNERLDATPFQSPGWGPFDWYAFVGTLTEAMYSAGGVRAIPLMVHDFAARGQPAFDDYEKGAEGMDGPPPSGGGGRGPLVAEVDAAVEKLFADPIAAQKYLGMNEGMYTSVTCSDSGQYETLEEGIANNAKVRPGFFDREGLEEELALCKAWPTSPKRPTTKLAVTSDIPTLSMGGEFDPVTPASWAEQVVKTLSKGTFLLMKGLAHGSMDACSRGIKGAFFAGAVAPLDTACNDARTLTFATSWTSAAGGGSFRRSKLASIARPLPRPVARPTVVVRGAR